MAELTLEEKADMVTGKETGDIFNSDAYVTRNTRPMCMQTPKLPLP